MTPTEPTRLAIVPITLAEANLLVERWHRHHGPSRGHKFSIGCADTELRGAAIVGRPVSRVLDDGWTLEVTRLVTDSTPHVASMLYAAAWRAARALGYRKLITTYTLATESGTSLIAAGWKIVGQTKGRSWDCLSRPRVDRHPTLDKNRWEAA